MIHRSLTQLAHQAIAEHLGAGDLAIDATVGNGHDTRFLAGLVGETGRVIGFDIQVEALNAARRLLAGDRLLERVQLLPVGHQAMGRHIPQDRGHRLQAVMFNLGYLPGGDKRIVTRPDSTLRALRQALDHLAPQGLLSLMAYRGHPGGMAEFEAVKDFLGQLSPERFKVGTEYSGPAKQPGPVLFLVSNQGRGPSSVASLSNNR